MREDLLEPNPEKPWLMKWEKAIGPAVIEVSPYEFLEGERTIIPPEDPYLKSVLNICECGHAGGDHRPYCIVIGCGCERMKETKEWEKKEIELRHLLNLGTMAGKEISDTEFEDSTFDGGM